MLFVLNVCSADWHLAINRLGMLRKVYPEAFILSIADGKVPSFYQEVCQLLSVDFVQAEAVKPFNTGGLWTHRYLKYGLQYETDLMIRVDPDTAVFARFDHIPDSDIFANLIEMLDIKAIMGGCLGFKRRAAQKIVNSEILLAKRYRTPEFTYVHSGSKRQVMGQDKILQDVVKRLCINLGQWDEVEIQPSGMSFYPNVPHYKALHPCLGIVV